MCSAQVRTATSDLKCLLESGGDGLDSAFGSLSRMCFGVLLVRHVLHPVSVVAVLRLVHSDMNHPVVGCCAMPVFFTWSNPYTVASFNKTGRFSPKLNATDARNHVKRLAQWMSVPSGSRVRFERDPRRLKAGWRGGINNQVGPNRPGEILGLSLARGYCAHTLNFQLNSPILTNVTDVLVLYTIPYIVSIARVFE